MRLVERVLLAALFTFGCSDGPTAPSTVTPSAPVLRMVEPARVFLGVGESQRFLALAGDSGLQPTDVQWRILDPGIASVARDGTVTALRPGTTALLAALGSHTIRHPLDIGSIPEEWRGTYQSVRCTSKRSPGPCSRGLPPFLNPMIPLTLRVRRDLQRAWGELTLGPFMSQSLSQAAIQVAVEGAEEYSVLSLVGFERHNQSGYRPCCSLVSWFTSLPVGAEMTGQLYRAQGGADFPDTWVTYNIAVRRER
jgi:hypothetical protein